MVAQEVERVGELREHHDLRIPVGAQPFEDRQEVSAPTNEPSGGCGTETCSVSSWNPLRNGKAGSNERSPSYKP